MNKRHLGDYNIGTAECLPVPVHITPKDRHHPCLEEAIRAEQQRFASGESAANICLTDKFHKAMIHALRTSTYTLDRIGCPTRINGSLPPQTRIGFRNGAGLDLFERKELAENGVWWCNVHEASPQSVSLRALQGFINYLGRWDEQQNAFKKIPIGEPFPRKNPDYRNLVQPIDTFGQSFAIFGHGRIGHAMLKRMLTDYGDMHYYIIDSDPRVPIPDLPNVEHVHYGDHLPILKEVLGTSLHVNGEVGQIFGKAELEALCSRLRTIDGKDIPPYLGSFGRGFSVENDVAAKFASSGILHPDFDVFADESQTSALAKQIGNAGSATPHIGGSIASAERNNGVATARYIREWLFGRFNPTDDERDLPFGKIDVPFPENQSGTRVLLTVRTNFRDICKEMMQQITGETVHAFTTPKPAVRQQSGGKISAILADISHENGKTPNECIDWIRRNAHDILSYRLIMLQSITKEYLPFSSAIATPVVQPFQDLARCILSDVSNPPDCE